MPDTLPELLDSRSHLLQELYQLRDFQPVPYLRSIVATGSLLAWG